MEGTISTYSDVGTRKAVSLCAGRFKRIKHAPNYKDLLDLPQRLKGLEVPSVIPIQDK